MHGLRFDAGAFPYVLENKKKTQRMTGSQDL